MKVIVGSTRGEPSATVEVDDTTNQPIRCNCIDPYPCEHIRYLGLRQEIAENNTRLARVLEDADEAETEARRVTHRLRDRLH